MDLFFCTQIFLCFFKLQNKLNAQAIQAGAFGGERSELFNRDALARAALEDYARNYEQAQQASMTAFENQQRRGQEAFEQQQKMKILIIK